MRWMHTGFIAQQPTERTQNAGKWTGKCTCAISGRLAALTRWSIIQEQLNSAKKLSVHGISVVRGRRSLNSVTTTVDFPALYSANFNLAILWVKSCFTCRSSAFVSFSFSRLSKYSLRRSLHFFSSWSACLCLSRLIISTWRAWQSVSDFFASFSSWQWVLQAISAALLDSRRASFS